MPIGSAFYNAGYDDPFHRRLARAIGTDFDDSHLVCVNTTPATLFATVAAFWGGPAAIAGIPEPDVIFYGTVAGATTSVAYPPSDVAWTIEGNGEKLTSNATTLVVVNGQTFYLTRFAFETRRLADNTPLAAAPNTLALTATPTAYSRRASVDGRTASISSGGENFSYSAATQGLVERVDLRVGGESFAAWAQRLFGAVANPSADADGDGQSNYNEYLAGTDPKNAHSGLFVKNFAPSPGGGYTFSWDSLANKVYSVERSSDLQNWATVFPNQRGTGGVMTYSDQAGAAQMFYRVKVSDP